MQVFVRAKICPDPCKRSLKLRICICTSLVFDLRRRKETLKSRVAKFSPFLRSNVIKGGSFNITFVENIE